MLLDKMRDLPPEEQNRILETLDFLVQQSIKIEKDCALNRTVFLFSTNFSTFRLSLMILCISDIY